MAISTTAFENTSIKTGPARRNSYRSKMVRCAKKPKKERTPERYKSSSTSPSSVILLCGASMQMCIIGVMYVKLTAVLRSVLPQKRGE